MGFIFGLITRLIKYTIYFVLFVVIVTLIPNLPPYTKFSSIQLEPTQPRTGPLLENGVLNKAEKLYEKKVFGPEGFQLYNGEVYASLGTGEIVKLSPGGHVTFVTKLGQPCQGPNQEPKCGRPLGFEIDEKKGIMYVADSYYGIWKVDIKTDKKQLLVSPQVEIDGRKPMLFNSVALAKNGDLYWTDSSSDFHLNKGAKSVLADPSGRLLQYNAATNKSKVLLDNIWFANGLAISPDHTFIVVSESSRYRLIRYYIDGPLKGKSDVFLAGLPGIPDNLRPLPDGSGFLVGMYVTFDEDTPFLAKSMAETPIVRKFLARMITFAEMPFEFINSHFPNVIFENIANNIGSFKSFSTLVPKKSGLLVVDWNGRIVESYFNTDGTLAHVSDAIVYKDKLLTGSPHSQDYVGAVSAPPLLRKAFASVKTTPPAKTPETVTKPVPKKVEEKPRVVEKKEAPKVAKTVAQEPPKPMQKPAEPVKATTPKPVEKKPTTPPPTTTTKPPKQTESTTRKPATTTTTTTTPKPSTTTTTPKPTTTTTTPKPSTTTTTPKPTTTTTTPKPSTTTTTPKPTTTTTTPKPTTKQPEPAKTTPPPPKKTEPKVEKPAVKPPPSAEPKKSSDSKQKPAEKNTKPVPDQIPIREEIPSDTAKPTKEKLKVIKKGGPTEIPNPEL